MCTLTTGSGTHLRKTPPPVSPYKGASPNRADQRERVRLQQFAWPLRRHFMVQCTTHFKLWGLWLAKIVRLHLQICTFSLWEVTFDLPQAVQVYTWRDQTSKEFTWQVSKALMCSVVFVLPTTGVSVCFSWIVSEMWDFCLSHKSNFHHKCWWVIYYQAIHHCDWATIGSTCNVMGNGIGWCGKTGNDIIIPLSCSTHLQIERGHGDIVAGLPQQVLIVWHDHVSVVRQVTVQLQHLRTVLHGAAGQSDDRWRKVSDESRRHLIIDSAPSTLSTAAPFAALCKNDPF